MKIKLINPNTTLEMTESIRLVAEKYKAAGTEIIAVSPKTGPDSIETFMDDYLAVPGVLKEIIDGDRKFSSLCAATLKKNGIGSDTAGDFESGLELALSDVYDFAVTDTTLKKGSGEELERATTNEKIVERIEELSKREEQFETWEKMRLESKRRQREDRRLNVFWRKNKSFPTQFGGEEETP